MYVLPRQLIIFFSLKTTDDATDILGKRFIRKPIFFGRYEFVDSVDDDEAHFVLVKVAELLHGLVKRFRFILINKKSLIILFTIGAQSFLYSFEGVFGVVRISWGVLYFHVLSHF
jgi:hypothetical protein